MHNSGIGEFAAFRIGVFVCHVWLLFWVVHNSPATPAADEIWVQKKRVVSDALIAKNGIIRAIWGLRYGIRKRKPDCRVSAE